MGYSNRTIVKSKLLTGQKNGQLSDNILVTIKPLPGVGGSDVRLIYPAARGYCAYRGTAYLLGHRFKPTSLFDSYRTYAVQYTTFMNRWTTQYIAGRPTCTFQGKKWYLKRGMAICAVPGTSNHGIACAIDNGEENNGNLNTTESLDNPTLTWLLNNEERFGFFHSVKSEPWHNDWFMGDVIPPAVLEWESIHGILGNGFPKPPQGDDEDMPNTFKMTPALHGTTQDEFWVSFGETRRLIKDNDDYGKLQLAYPNLRPLATVPDGKPMADHNGWPTGPLAWTVDEIDRLLGAPRLAPAEK